MIYKNRSMHGTKSETDIYVENDTGAICLWQYSVERDARDLIQITTAADADRLIEVIRGMIDKTWSPKPSKDEQTTTAQQIALGIGGGK